ncbi:hypothetical protein EV175_000484 [Coemansia sp. RSA 1933]|nr:hypothetical protein EV175_000484 [Coemansia sp. RSA 1933]
MGFNPDDVCTGTYSGIGLDTQVFQRGIYHTKAAELIFHFLLMRLDSVRFKREFFDVWPIADPKQAREFRGHVFKWLEEIRRESTETRDRRWPLDTPVRRSYIDESKGVRFEQVLWALTSFVAHALLRNGSGAWSKYLKHQMVVNSAGDMDRDMAETVSKALGGCRARYARRMRDRMRAQETWKETQRELQKQIGDADAQRSCAHEAYRTLRMKMGSVKGGAAIIPGVDASVEDIEGALGAMVDETKRLWSRSAGWIEENQRAIGLVDAVMEKRANSVRLDGHKHVRLAPPPQLAAEWARWLAEQRATPFRGADIDLPVVVRMASACVGALRRSLSPDGRLTLENSNAAAGGGGCALLGEDRAGERIRQLDQLLEEQESRIERLKRVREQLAEQQCKAERIVWESRSGCVGNEQDGNGVVSLVAATPTAANNVGHLAAAISRFAIGPSSSPEQQRTPTAAFARCTMKEKGDSACKRSSAAARRRRTVVRQLQDLWDDSSLTAPDSDDTFAERILASAWPPGLASSVVDRAGGGGGAAPRLSLMSVASDSSMATLSSGGSRKRAYRSIAEQTHRPANFNDSGDAGFRRIKRQASSQADDNEFDERMLVDEGIPEFLVQ